MKNLKTFNLNIGTVILRFYLMMMVVIVAGFTGQWWIGFLALPIFLSIMMGITFNPFKIFEKKTNASTVILKNTRNKETQAVA